MIERVIYQFNNRTPKVSVIIPVYGVEKYIERCIRSLFSQTLDNIEYIFIDDCTPDNSMNILYGIIEEYYSHIKDNNWSIKTIKMLKNSGISAVRREGIMSATGEYLIYCDSDDWVEPQMYKKMYEKAIDEQTDIVVCDFFVSTDYVDTKYIGTRSNQKNLFLYNLIKRKESWAVWNKLVLRSLYLNITYPKFPMGEDMVLCLQVVDKCKKIAYLRSAFYHYYTNIESITHKKDEKHLIKLASQFCENVSLVDHYFQDETDSEIRNSIIALKNIARNHYLPLVNNKKYYRKWLNTFPEINRYMFYSSAIPFKEKLRYWKTRLSIVTF